MLPGSKLLRLPGALQGHCPKWALFCAHFPGLSCSGSRVLREGTDPGWACVLRPSQVGEAQVTTCLASASPQVGCASESPPWSQLLSSPGAQESTVSGVLCVSSGELISGCDPPGRYQPSRIPGRCISNWD